MAETVRRKHLLEAWVDARLNPEKADFNYLNMETARVVGPREEYDRFMAEVNAEVAKRKTPAEYIADRANLTARRDEWRGVIVNGSRQYSEVSRKLGLESSADELDRLIYRIDELSSKEDKE